MRLINGWAFSPARDRRAFPTARACWLQRHVAERPHARTATAVRVHRRPAAEAVVPQVRRPSLSARIRFGLRFPPTASGTPGQPAAARCATTAASGRVSARGPRLASSNKDFLLETDEAAGFVAVPRVKPRMEAEKAHDPVEASWLNHRRTLPVPAGAAF